MKKIHFLWALCCLLSFTACIDERADNPPVYPNRAVLFYLAGDNSLSHEVQQKIDALTRAWSSPTGRLLIYADAGGDTGARLLEIQQGTDGANRVEVIETYGVQNSASGSVFARAINRMCERYPSTGYGLVMFSHGSGWLPDNSFIVPRSVVTDNEYQLDIVDFASQIPDGLFEFIVFESCLMASLEVAYQLQDKTSRIVASSAEMVSPGFAPLYDRLLPCLYAEVPQLEKLAQTYFDHYNAQQGDNRSATISVIDPRALKGVEALIPAAESRVTNWDQIGRHYIQHFDRRRDEHLFYDAAEYMRRIGTREEFEAFNALLNNAVLYRAATPAFLPTDRGFDIQYHCGLTMYIPSPRLPHINAYRSTLKLFEPLGQQQRSSSSRVGEGSQATKPVNNVIEHSIN